MLTPGSELGHEIFKMRLNYADYTLEMEPRWPGFHPHWQVARQNEVNRLFQSQKLGFVLKCCSKDSHGSSHSELIPP
jgi:hypothetical protein